MLFCTVLGSVRHKTGTKFRGADAARELHAHGTDDETIQGVMRHSELRTTTNIYIKSNLEAGREGLQKVGESFRSRKVVNIKSKSA